MIVSRGALGGVAALGFAMAVAVPAVGDPVSYGFTAIGDGAANATISASASQFTVSVASVSGFPQLVDFTFRNVGSIQSSITDVYFDDGALLGIASIANGPGVVYSNPATPGNLPGGNTISPAFVTTAGFSADSSPPVQPNGVNNTLTNTEWVRIRFNLQANKTFADVISGLTLGLTNPSQAGSLRIGIHVQGYANGGSGSFVFIPLPTTAYLGGAGLAGVMAFGWIRRRRLAAS